MTRHVDPDLRAKIRASIEADYGQHTMMAGNAIPPVRRLPSRSLALNYIMGGGYPMGMITRFWGAWSSGKTTEILNTFAQAQAHGMKCLLVCTEKVFDEALAVRLGVSLKQDDFELVMNRRIETIGDIVQKALGGYHVIAVDSTTGTMTLDELAHKDGISGEAPTSGMIRAKKWGINLDWWQDRINPENVLLITSQIQSSIGMSTGQRMTGEKAPGGEKLNHEPAVVLHFMKAGRLKRRDDGGLEPVGEEGGDKGVFGNTARFNQPAGGEVVVRCDKNKVGKQGRVALLHHDRSAANFDPLHELEKMAKYFQVVKRSGGANSSWFLLPDGSKAQSIRRAIEESPELARAIEEVVLRCSSDPEFEDRLLRSKGGAGEMMVEGVA